MLYFFFLVIWFWYHCLSLWYIFINLGIWIVDLSSFVCQFSLLFHWNNLMLDMRSCCVSLGFVRFYAVFSFVGCEAFLILSVKVNILLHWYTNIFGDKMHIGILLTCINLIMETSNKYTAVTIFCSCIPATSVMNQCCFLRAISNYFWYFGNETYVFRTYIQKLMLYLFLLNTPKELKNSKNRCKCNLYWIFITLVCPPIITLD